MATIISHLGAIGLGALLIIEIRNIDKVPIDIWVYSIALIVIGITIRNISNE